MQYREFDTDLYVTLVKLGYKHIIQNFNPLDPAEVEFKDDGVTRHIFIEPLYEHMPYHEREDNAIYHINDPEVMEMSSGVEDVYFWVKQPL